MESNVNYTLVGLFVVLLTAVLIGIIVWMNADGGQYKRYRTYEVLMNESVSGLNRHARVKYRGVDVGQVSDISLLPEMPDKVRLLLELETITPLNQETSATLHTHGLTGLAYIELSGGDADSPPLEVAEGQVYPRLKTGQSFLVRLDTSLSNLLAQLQHISDKGDRLMGGMNRLADQANLLLSEQNRIAIAAILQHVEVISGTFAARHEDWDRSLRASADMLSNAAILSEDLRVALPELLEDGGAALAVLEETLFEYQIVAENADQLLDSSQPDLQRSLRAMAASSEILRATLAHTSRDVETFTAEALPQVREVLSNFQAILQPLRQLAENLQRQPNQLLFGKPMVAPGPGER